MKQRTRYSMETIFTETSLSAPHGGRKHCRPVPQLSPWPATQPHPHSQGRCTARPRTVQVVFWFISVVTVTGTPAWEKALPLEPTSRPRVPWGSEPRPCPSLPHLYPAFLGLQAFPWPAAARMWPGIRNQCLSPRLVTWHIDKR